MKKEKISMNVIRRLPRYLRKLEELCYNGVERISSGELGQQLALTPSQIRQDLSCFGEFGQQGYGYNVQKLRDEIQNILGMNKGFSAILIGAGNLGHALLENFGFAGNGFELKAAFDVNPKLIGTTVGDTPVFDMAALPAYLAEHPADIAVLTVPRRVANETARLIVENGVRAIWNFANIELEISDPDVLVENIHFSDSLLTLSYYLAESTEEERT